VFEAASMQHRLGVSRRLLHTTEHEIARSTERRTVEAGRHRCVRRIAGVLAIDDHRHLSHRRGHVVAGHDAVQ
jgi:hypothetical protein